MFQALHRKRSSLDTFLSMHQTALMFLILAQCLGQSLSDTVTASSSSSFTRDTVTANMPHFPGVHSGSRLAYFRWRTWLLNHPAVQQKIPPIPKTKRNYNSSAETNSNAVKVNARVVPSNILHVDEAKQIVEVAGRLDFNWNDPALALDSDLIDQFTDGDDSSLPQSVTIPAWNVWLPSIIITEGVSVLKVLDLVRDLEVLRDGTVAILLTAVVSFSCRFEMSRYPYDRHDCTLTLLDVDATAGVYPFGGLWDQSIPKEFGVAGEWELTAVQSRTLNASTVAAPFAQFTISLRRKTTFYSVIIVLPLVLTSYLNVLVFLLPPDLGDKCSYLVTVTISLSVFTSFFNVDMPRSFDAMPRVFHLFVFVLAEGFVTLLMSLVVIRQYKREKNAVEEALAGVVPSREERNAAASATYGRGNTNSIRIQRDAERKSMGSRFGRGDNSNGMQREGEVSPAVLKFKNQKEEEMDGNWEQDNVGCLGLRQERVVESNKNKKAVGASFRFSARNLDAIFFVVVFTANTLGMSLMLVSMVQLE